MDNSRCCPPCILITLIGWLNQCIDPKTKMYRPQSVKEEMCVRGWVEKGKGKESNGRDERMRVEKICLYVRKRYGLGGCNIHISDVK